MASMGWMEMPNIEMPTMEMPSWMSAITGTVSTGAESSTQRGAAAAQVPSLRSCPNAPKTVAWRQALCVYPALYLARQAWTRWHGGRHRRHRAHLATCSVLAVGGARAVKAQPT